MTDPGPTGGAAADSAEPNSIGALLAKATSRLARARVPTPRHDALRILEHATGQDGAWLLARRRERLERDAAARFARALVRRAGREPLQHILGRWPFLELDLATDRRALIPRPETEDVACAGLDLLPRGRAVRVADIGTGGGCIALALAHADASISLAAVDVSPEALALARENVAACSAGKRVRLIRGDLLAPFAPRPLFDLIIANLPYVADREAESLAPEVRAHEPDVALYAGRDGLGLIRRLTADALNHLVPGGWLVLEIAPGQRESVIELLSARGFEDVAVTDDRFGRARIAKGRRPD